MAEQRGRGKKENTDKNFQAHKTWKERKGTGRPYQMFDPTTKTWKKIEGVKSEEEANGAISESNPSKV